MNLEKITKTYRRESRDEANPPFVSNDLVRIFANQGEVEAARRARLLVDSTSPICRVNVSAGNPIVEIDQRIISIRRARLESRSVPIVLRKVRDMDDAMPGWDSSSSQSTPFILVVDYATGKLYLHSTPKSDDILLLTVTREPLCEMEDDDDSPEIAPRYHHGIVAWIKHRAFLTDDTDFYDANRSANALADFESEFGKRISAADEQFEFENYHDVGER